MWFNGTDFEDYLVVEFIRRKLLPSTEVKDVKVPGRAGTVFSNRTIDTTVIEVGIRIIGVDRLEVQEKARDIAGLLMVDEPKRLELRDEPERYNIAILEGDFDNCKFLNTGFTTLKFLCNDPYAYSIIPVDIKNVGGKTVINKGTAPATGVITIKLNKDVTNLKVNLVELGEFVYVEGKLAKGDTIVIDLDDAWVKRNGVLIMHDVHLTSDFFDLPPGPFTITTTAGTMDLQFRERWL